MRFRIGALAGVVAIAGAFGGVKASASNNTIPARSFETVASVSDTPRKTLYVGDYAHNLIDIYRAGVLNPKQIGTITKGVADVAVDRNGAVDVLNT